MNESITIVRFIFRSGLSHLKFKFSGSTSSVLWTFANPLFYIILYSIVFSQIFDLSKNSTESDGNFLAYLCIGLLPWLIWAEGLIECSSCLSDNGYYLKKIALPTWAFVAKTCFAFFLYNLIATLILVIFSIIMGYQLNLYWLLLPLHIFIFHLFAFGICLFTSMLTVFTRDATHLLNMFIQLIFWSMPIVYYSHNLPTSLQEFSKYHPIYSFILPIRNIIMNPANYSFMHLLITVILSLVVVAFGMIIHRKFELEIRDAL